MRAKLIRRGQIATGTYSALWQPAEKLNFSAGQYLLCSLVDPAYTDSQGDSREFSIASSPNTPEIIEIAWRDSPSAFKRSLLAMEPEQEIEIKGPYGHFTLSANDQPITLLAGGIGITPLLSIGRYLAEEKDRRSVVLLSANNSLDKVPFRAELAGLTAKNPNFRGVEHIGMLKSNDLLALIPDISERVCLIAGPPQLVFDLRQSLQSAGVPEENIFYEDFIGYE